MHFQENPQAVRVQSHDCLYQKDQQWPFKTFCEY